MKTQKQTKEEMTSLETLRMMAEALAQIASGRMRKTRQGVLKTREFVGELAEIFEEVRRSYRREVLALGRRRGKKGKITFLAHNGRTVAVLLSANTGLYGEIVKRTFDLFLKEVAKQNVEATIIGKLGMSMLLESKLKIPYSFFELPDWGEGEEKLVAILRHLVEYERVLVFFGKFGSVIRQEPKILEVSAESFLETQGQGPKKKYYFEPTLEEILMFFEAEMFGLLFDQTVRESTLAKFASRMMAMDQAAENIETRLKQMALVSLKLRHLNDNRKQQNRFASMEMW